MMETIAQEQVLVDHNPGTLSVKISDACADGWRVDPGRPLTMLGYLWEVWLIRSATAEQIASDAEEAAKPSRADILAKARTAKAEKKKAEAEASEAPPVSEEAPKADAAE